MLVKHIPEADLRRYLVGARLIAKIADKYGKEVLPQRNRVINGVIELVVNQFA
ncbi:MAG: hypothetical protein AB1489_33270 [Acidobacteriota bacterium]